ncbi:MAG: DUF4097 family beta strand repeat protein [Clostridia bacterium]|nr:DUF4097 family beta strand repeat protein [Clostridia bacterium]
MNERIRDIVDGLFSGTVENEETLALHEEVMNNCQEHFADLVARGETEDEAVRVIEESLRGMREVIAEYPRKESGEPETGEAAADPADEPASDAAPDGETDAAAGEAPEKGHWVFDDIRSLQVSLRDQDISVIPSADGRLHLRCGDPERISWEVSGDGLRVTGNDRFRRMTEMVREEEKPADFSLDGILNYVGKVVNIFRTQMSYASPLEVAVPGGVLRELDLNTASGDISCQGPTVETLRTHTASGDIEIIPSNDATMNQIVAGTASGDVRLRASAAEAELSTMSGDVFAAGAYDTVRMKSVSGDAEFRGSVITLKLQSVSGDAEAVIDNESLKRVDAKTTSGDLRILLPADLEAVHAECSSRSGECENRISDAGSDAPIQVRAATVSGDVLIQRQ